MTNMQNMTNLQNMTNMTNMSNMQIPNLIWTPPLYMTNMDPPFFYMSFFCKYVEYNSFLKSQIGPYRSGKARFEISTICKICQIC